MDLFAYSQIKDLEEVAAENNISVPRLRGYRLMANEEKVDWKTLKQDVEYVCTEHMCSSVPFWKENSDWSRYSSSIQRIEEFYITKDKKPRWDRIHGWKRKALKTMIHNYMRRVQQQYEMWNKYVGRSDILYIHSRIGGGNWPSYREEVVNQPWFIEKVDDWFDCTYCDIYARIKEGERKEYGEIH